MSKFSIFRKLFLLLIVVFQLTLVYSQNKTPTVKVDSITTPFRKGRWLTSLSGNISTSSTELKSNTDKTISNEFALNLSTGKFIKERWLFGVTFQVGRQQTKGEIDIVGETLYIGPQFARYFSEGKDGSLYLNVSPGFVLFRSLSSVGELPDFGEEANGNGFGTLVSLGYSYVMRDLISFNIGFNLQYGWVGVDTIDNNGMVGTDNVTISNLSFTFGFGVILDDFFF